MENHLDLSLRLLANNRRDAAHFRRSQSRVENTNSLVNFKDLTNNIKETLHSSKLGAFCQQLLINLPHKLNARNKEQNLRQRPEPHP